MMIVLGSIDYGWFFYMDHVVTNAAREGARAGTLWANDTDAETDATDTATAVLTAGGLTNSPTIDVDFVDVGSPSAPAVKVTVTYAAGSLTGFLGSLVPANAKAVSTMRRQ